MPRAGFWAVETHAIRFGKDGYWYADHERIVNQRIATLFSRHVVRESDGSYWLRIGDERARIEIEDTPFVVTSVDGDPQGGFRIRLNDGTEEPLPASTLQLGEGDVLYCAVKHGEHGARFLRSAQLALLEHVRETDGRYVLPLPGGHEQPIRSRAG